MIIALRKLVYLSFLVTSILYFSGCKEKGCTDPSALNYNSVAEEDDGSCITCAGITDTIATDSCIVRDNNFGSIHYQDTVGIFYFTQTHTEFEHAECGVNKCLILLQFKSFVPEKMSFSFNVQASGGNMNFFYSDNITVPGFTLYNIGSITEQNISNPCNSIAQTNINCNLTSIIIYN